MDVTAARAALGVDASTPWEAVHEAYRRAIRAAHPDVDGGSTRGAALVNEAWTTLVRARRDGTGATTAPMPAPAAPAPPPPRWEPVEGVVLAVGDTLLLPVPPDEAFVVVLEACHRVGDVTYVDRQCGILEVLLQVAGEGTCSLVVTFQGRSHGTEAFCTLEAIEHVATPPVDAIVHELGEVVAELLHLA